MKIEQAKPKDWQRVRAIRLRALQQAPDVFGSTLDKEIKFPDQHWIDRVSPGGRPTFLCSSQSRDLGLVSCGPISNGFGISSMWVDPIARGKGAGYKLLSAAIDFAKKNKAERIYLEVTDSNITAITFYERNGFIPTGVNSTFPAPRNHITEHQRVLELI